METIYVDEYFLLNLAIDYFLLLATAKICGLPCRRGRFILGAMLGALWCCLSLLPRLAFLRTFLMQPVLGLAVTLAAFGGEIHLFRCFLAFLGVSALFGGAVYAALLWQGTRAGGPLLRLDLRVLALSFALCWALVSLVFRRSVKDADRRLHDVELARGDRAVTFRALEDTGNGLFDSLTGRNVLIAEGAVLAPLFPGLDPVLLTGPPADLMPRIPGARLLPYAGLGGDRRLLVVFRPDRIAVDGRTREDLVAAIAPAPLDDAGRFQGLI